MAAVEAEIAVERVELLLLAQAIGGDERVSDRGRPDRQHMIEPGRAAQAAIGLVLDVLHVFTILG